MFSKIPVNLEDVGKKEKDLEILRAALMAELDSINLYRQLAAAAENENVRKLLVEVAGAEKIHVGEFQTLLLRLDPRQAKKSEEGEETVRKLLYTNEPVEEEMEE